MSKHDTDCLRRKTDHPFLCTCHTTEAEYLAAEKDRAERVAAYAIAERDCYREALEQIASGAGNGRPSLDAAQAMNVARQALELEGKD